MRKHFSLVTALSAIVALVLATSAFGMILLRPPSLAAAAVDRAPLREITVIGKGEVTAPPDRAIVYLGVTTEAPTPTAALSDNTAKMQALLAQLQASGVADKDIQTSNFSIYRHEGPPPHVGMEAPMQEGMGPDQPAVTYQASNTVVVTVHNVAQTGELLENVVEAGANHISNVAFDIAEPAALEQAAREQALADARARAEALAKASGATLGQLRYMTENLGASMPGSYPGAMPAAEAAAAAPLQPGEQTLTAYLQVTFEVK